MAQIAFVDDQVYKIYNDVTPAALSDMCFLACLAHTPDVVKVLAYIPPATIVLEKMDCDLRRYIHNTPRKERLKYVYRLVRFFGRCLATLERQHIAHLDIKPDNVLVKQTADGPVFRLSDFGNAFIASRDRCYSTEDVYTPAYRAPELAKETLTSDELHACDVYAAGLTIREYIDDTSAEPPIVARMLAKENRVTGVDMCKGLVLPVPVYKRRGTRKIAEYIVSTCRGCGYPSIVALLAYDMLSRYFAIAREIYEGEVYACITLAATLVLQENVLPFHDDEEDQIKVMKALGYDLYNPRLVELDTRDLVEACMSI